MSRIEVTRPIAIGLMVLGLAGAVAAAASPGDDRNDPESLLARVDSLALESPDEAIRLGESLMTRLDDRRPELRMRLYAHLIAAYRVGDRLEDASRAANELMTLAREQGAPRYIGEAHKSLGNVALLEGRLDEAIQQYRMARSHYETAGYARGIGDALNNIGVAHSYQGRNGQALEAHKEAFPYLREAGDRSSLANNWGNLGNSYAAMGQRDEALDAYLRSLSINEAAGQKHAIASNLNNIGLLYEELDQLDKALEAWQRGLRVVEEAGGGREAAVLSVSIGNAYTKLGDYDKAEEFLENAAASASRLGYRRTEASAYHSLGVAAFEQEDFDRALSYYRRTVDLDQAMGADSQVAATRVRIAELEMARGRADRAIPLLQTAITTLSSNEDRSFLVSALESLSAAHEKEGNHRAALEAFRRFKAVSDEMKQTESSRRLEQLQTRFELDLKESQIEELQRGRQLQELRAEQQVLWRNILVGGILTAIVLLLVMIREYRMKMHTNRELARLATIDPLTGAFNRRHIMDIGNLEMARSKRYGTAVSLLVLDIDWFKGVNDTYGHKVGDKALQAVAEACRANLREADLLARIGGEEFVVLLPHTDAAGACLAAERIRQAVADTPIATGDKGGDLRVTVSIGSSTRAKRDTTFEQLVNEADRALYRAKNEGRNRTVHAYDAPPGIRAASE